MDFKDEFIRHLKEGIHLLLLWNASDEDYLPLRRHSISSYASKGEAVIYSYEKG